MIYSEFKLAATRSDNISNDNVHYFSSYLATPIAYCCYKIGLSPNQITFIFGLVGFSCGILFYLKLPILAYILWRFHIILDMVDGSVARATQVFSKNASGFDRSNHIIINTTVLLAPHYGNTSLITINILIFSFYLYYFFSRNYEINKSNVRHFSITKNIVKNIFSLEGYILSMVLVVYYEIDFLIVPSSIFYSFTFFTLFLIKLRYRIKS